LRRGGEQIVDAHTDQLFADFGKAARGFEAPGVAGEHGGEPQPVENPDGNRPHDADKNEHGEQGGAGFAVPGRREWRFVAPHRPPPGPTRNA
jgi:hypothetical protein